ncbi:hypothetical protein H6G76_32660 [Nostoc sp. FACHB-152]|uniref:DUF6174 domain-containing protein n=1 Tax=unclassified Nostoc TaxID=2593658 RepID=UPI001683A22F|nr:MULTISPECIES: DUF6174 domain-containing protein [unclassified Nostoc]MBD2451790.1 hypothetical protein [Nostoc sp. FACHB-152]MBD2472889.1 hypothetical protein [Nostoc sp. FACHB-145]
MRLPVAISTILLASLSLNAPVLSDQPIQVVQAPTSTRFNWEKLKINHRLWRGQNISNYRYEFTRSCNCLPKATAPVIIEVRNGITTSITDKETGKPADAALFQRYKTIPKLFYVIKDALVRRAANLTVEYDPVLHYPTQINIDYNNKITDDEIFITISNLEKIK